jgi:hypothetical protein
MKPEGLLPDSQVVATGLLPDPEEFNPHIQKLFLEIALWYHPSVLMSVLYCRPPPSAYISRPVYTSLLLQYISLIILGH